MNCFSVEEVKDQFSHPYRNSEYLTTQVHVFRVPDNDDELQNLFDMYGEEGLIYLINWDEPDLYTEDGQKIEPVY